MIMPWCDMDGCELCEGARLTRWYFEDDLCWIAECEACFVPMVVWREHGVEPPPAVRAAMLERLAAVMAELGIDHYVDDRRRTIPDHWHAHGRRRW
jgi:hypothetical protein